MYTHDERKSKNSYPGSENSKLSREQLLALIREADLHDPFIEHPINGYNRLNLTHLFTPSGKYIEEWDGLDGNRYARITDAEDFTPELWDLYEKEGITFRGPVPIEDVVYLKRPPE